MEPVVRALGVEVPVARGPSCHYRWGRCPMDQMQAQWTAVQPLQEPRPLAQPTTLRELEQAREPRFVVVVQIRSASPQIQRHPASRLKR